MRVLGHNVCMVAIGRAIEDLAGIGPFTSGDLVTLMHRRMPPEPAVYVYDEAANRMLQRARKAGLITYSGGRWRQAFAGEDGHG